MIHEHFASYADVKRTFDAVEGTLLECEVDRGTAVAALLSIIAMQFAQRQLSTEELQAFMSAMTEYMSMYFMSAGDVKH